MSKVFFVTYEGERMSPLYRSWEGANKALETWRAEEDGETYQLEQEVVFD